jgi:ribonuclease E
LKTSVYGDCPCCTGRGIVKTAESMAIEVVRVLQLAAHAPRVNRITVRVNDEVAAYLNNKKRKEILRIEDEAQISLQILGSESHYPEHLELDCRDAEGREVPVTV